MSQRSTPAPFCPDEALERSAISPTFRADSPQCQFLSFGIRLAVLWVFGVSGGHALAEKAPIVEPAQVDAVLSALVENGEAVGASALIWERGEEAYFGAFGKADDDADRPMQRDTIVQIFSMTKPITGVALLTLWEKGLFDLDDPIAKYVPELTDLKVYAGEDAEGETVLVEPARAPTIRDFTRHTAGLTHGGEDSPVAAHYRRENPLDRTADYDAFAERLGRVPLLYHPGERWVYADSVDVQALLIERLTGKPYADYLRETIFEPLGMHETGYLVPQGEQHRIAALYDGEDVNNPLVRLPDDHFLNHNIRQNFTLDPGGWGLASTLDDYMRFARMLLNEGEIDGVRILQAETVRMMATDHLPATVTDTSWLSSKGQVGFGIDVAVRIAPPASREENFGVVGEFFWDGLGSTLFWIDPENEIASVFFMQRIPFYGKAHKLFRDAVYARRIAEDEQNP